MFLSHINVSFPLSSSFSLFLKSISMSSDEFWEKKGKTPALLKAPFSWLSVIFSTMQT